MGSKDCLPRPRRRWPVCTGPLLAAALCANLAGCINSLVMFGKVLMGDPTQVSGFERATGISLKKEKKRILVHCSAPFSVSSDYGNLTANFQEELFRRMRRNGLDVCPPDTSARILDERGGAFDAQLLATKASEVDYIMHIQIEGFDHREASSPTLFRGQATGSITGYEVRQKDGNRQVLRVFDQQFRTYYPSTYPVPADQTPKTVFIRRFTDHVADSLGATFYDVSASSLFAE